MRLIVFRLASLVLGLGVVKSQEAVAFFGGEYPDGYLDNEVESWSSTSCTLEIPSSPDSFRDRPGVALLGDDVFVCGGHRMGTSHTTATCDVYSLSAKDWREGPQLPENPDNVHMTTVGSKLAAAYMSKNTTSQMVVSILDQETKLEWTILATIEAEGSSYSQIAQVDDKHVGVVKSYIYGIQYVVNIVNLETGKVTIVDSAENEYCTNPFTFNGKFTCVFGDGSLYSLTFSGEDGPDPEWTLVATYPPGDRTIFAPYLQLNGMLTALSSLDYGLIYYLEDEEWKMGEIEIARHDPGFAILPC